VFSGTVQNINSGERFDTIIYVDVLEHIEHDYDELVLAASRLRTSGCIVVLSPAHQYLFSPFDAAIGHFRRYNRRSLRRITPPTLVLESMYYLDSVGLAASLSNVIFLRQSLPTIAQIQFWDRWIIPISRITDKVFRYRLGKTIVAVWRKP
jgi:hypothetical protein